MIKILVVDDEVDLQALIKQKFRKKIREKEYVFSFALNGNEALSRLEEEEDISVVLSDINMPEMDGLTLLSKLGEKNYLLKSVIVSAYGDMENIRVAMNRGAFDFITKPINFDDLQITLEKTISHVQSMQETIRAFKENDILKMYVDETVLNFMGTREFESSLRSNENIEASVVFIDICSFTSISEKESPDIVVHLLNHYFDVMVKEIVGHGGHVDKFIGDAIMAIFKGDHHLDRAIETCLAVRDKIKDPQEVDGREFNLEVSMGIHQGEMVSGNIGSAELRRLDFTVIGDVVNTAQRLESVAQPGQIIISEDSYQKVHESFQCKKVGAVQLKHKTGETQVYEVIE